MSAKNPTEASRRDEDKKAADAASTDGRGRSRGAKRAPGDLGKALKTVYDDTLREDVPKDFLDLLGKLN